ncbi:MAG: efflux RND transporter periplasmic adaptor subunit [Acidimicrobiia bacterium]|nr:efflux RND transporter periplasmic adaptor subunit [Acidimicrobiia bacterium]
MGHTPHRESSQERQDAPHTAAAGGARLRRNGGAPGTDLCHLPSRRFGRFPQAGGEDRGRSLFARNHEMKPSLFTTALALLALVACNGVDPAPGAKAATKTTLDPVEIRAAAAESRTVERAIDATGSLYPDEAVAISAEVAGRVSTILVDYGQSVRKGQVIAELDAREYQLQLERSRATLAQALARIGLNPDQEDARPESTPAIRQARAQHEDARSKFESAKKLIASGDISRERYTELEKALAARRAALDAAEDDLRTQLASIQALRAEKALVEKRIADCTVRAPFDAIVEERLASLGQFVKDNVPLVRLVKSWPLRVRLNIPEVAAGAVRIGDRIRFTTEALPGEEFSAVLTQMNPALDARSRSLSVEARIGESGTRLRPGMFVKARLVLDNKAQIVAVPKEALYTVAGLTKLFTIEDGKARERRVEPGDAIDGWVEVPAGVVKPGQPVAVDQLARLTDGAAVRVRI